MHREHHKWYSGSLNREMELLQFGHAGARVIVFPTQSGKYWDWEDRGMFNTLSRHLDNGWVQVYCVDSIDPEAWDNPHASSRDKALRHLQYHDYIVNEVLPFSQSQNDNGYVMAMGASMGAFHAASIALRFPYHFNRMIAMSGIYDIRQWTGGYSDDVIYQCNPAEFIYGEHNGRLDQIKTQDLIIAIGKDDPAIDENRQFSQALWDKGIWHSFREWDGFAHDWPYWHEMILHYIGGPETRG